MDELNDLDYSKGVLRDYIITLGALRVLNLHSGSSSGDYQPLIELVKIRVDRIKSAFASRDFLRDYCDYDISEKILEGFRDFLDGKKKTLENIDEKINSASDRLESLKFLN